MRIPTQDLTPDEPRTHRVRRIGRGQGRDSARYIRIRESMSGSGVRPSRAARSDRTLAGQVANILATAGSGTQSISARASGPAVRSRASAIWATDTVSAGRFTAVRPPQAWSEDVAAHNRPPMALAGDASTTSVPGSTGHVARRPASGSRMMPDRKPEAAALGRPGRTLIVISRIARPRRKPLRV